MLSTEKRQINEQVNAVVTTYFDDSPNLSYLEMSSDDYYTDLLKTPKKHSKGTYSPRYARRLANQYAKQDKARLDAYERGLWHMIGICVDLYVKEIRVSGDSLWGIESDSNPEYLQQTIQDLISEATYHAKQQYATFAEIAQIVQGL